MTGSPKEMEFERRLQSAFEGLPVPQPENSVQLRPLSEFQDRNRKSARAAAKDSGPLRQNTVRKSVVAGTVSFVTLAAGVFVLARLSGWAEDGASSRLFLLVAPALLLTLAPVALFVRDTAQRVSEPLAQGAKGPPPS